MNSHLLHVTPEVRVPAVAGAVTDRWLSMLLEGNDGVAVWACGTEGEVWSDEAVGERAAVGVHQETISALHQKVYRPQFSFITMTVCDSEASASPVSAVPTRKPTPRSTPLLAPLSELHMKHGDEHHMASCYHVSRLEGRHT